MPTKVRARSAAAAVAGKNGHSLISDEKFRQLYATMLKYRLLEERLRFGLADSAEGAHSQLREPWAWRSIWNAKTRSC